MKRSLIFSLYILVQILVSAVTQAEVDIAPSKLIELVLSSLEQPLPKNGDECKLEEKLINCTVKDYLNFALTGIAEVGFNKKKTKYLKDKKKIQNEIAPDGQAAWSSAECKLSKPNEYPSLIKSLKQNQLHHKSFVDGLKIYKEDKIFLCQVSWGVDFGELKWTKELRFFLDSQQKLMANSFGVFSTP